MATSAAGSVENMLAISCQSCGAELQIGQHERSLSCPYCASPTVVERPETSDRPNPDFVIGFVSSQEHAAARVKSWIQSRGWFCDSSIKRAKIESTRGVYLPAYLFSGIARTKYNAKIGENYTVTESYTTTDSNGKTVQRTRTRIKTEWRALSGRHSSYVCDVLVTASKGIPNQELERIEPFQLGAMQRYSGALIAGWSAEDPSRSQAACLKLAKSESRKILGQRLSAFMPGDHHKDLRYKIDMQGEQLSLVLLPLWVFALRYRQGTKTIRILVNGQTGKISGKVPLSPLKIAVAVVLSVLGLASLAVVLKAVVQ